MKLEPQILQDLPPIVIEINPRHRQPQTPDLPIRTVVGCPELKSGTFVNGLGLW